MRISLRTLLISLGLALTISPALAVDNNSEINDINLNEENFLDIKAHRFRKSLEYQWFDNVTAWRMTGASLDGDLAFLQTELKLEHELSEYVNVRLEVEQEVFYADKEFPLPTAEVEFYPWAGDFGFSLLGTPAYEKREMDLGIALIWGRRPWNYTRFEYIEVDSLYNQKNASDNTFYSKQPNAMKLEGAYQFGGHYKLRFTVSRDKPLELIDPDNNSVFKTRGSDYYLLFDYQPVADSVIGITINGFTLDKSSSQTGQNQQQATDYISADIYWVKGMGKQYEFRVGTQYDNITNDIRDFITTSNDMDYVMKTLQVYATAYHPFNEHMAWDLGLYIGQVEERQNFLQGNTRDTLNDGVEAKFRMGFEYSSSDGRSSLQFNLSLNADDPINDPGDGAGISFQSVF
ncbi:MAG: hypothetical protein ACC650_06400 [Gammaproteobacteria bacterium]